MKRTKHAYKIQVFWNKNPCRLVKSVRSYRRFGNFMSVCTASHKPEDLNLQKKTPAVRTSDLAKQIQPERQVLSLYLQTSRVLKHIRLSLLYAITWPLTSFPTVT
jgi:hypothetical protein